MGFVPFTFVDFIDIILVAVIMYWIYRMTKGTNAPYILSGIIAIYLLWVVVRTLNITPAVLAKVNELYAADQKAEKK